VVNGVRNKIWCHGHELRVELRRLYSLHATRETRRFRAERVQARLLNGLWHHRMYFGHVFGQNKRLTFIERRHHKFSVQSETSPALPLRTPVPALHHRRTAATRQPAPPLPRIASSLRSC
jgi:tRNA G10  N-methylase Trm11